MEHDDEVLGEMSRLASIGPGVDARGASGVQVGEHNHQVNILVAGSYVASVPADVSWPVTVGRAPLPANTSQPRPMLRSAVLAGVSPGSSLVVTGDGGTGKTQLVASVFRDLAAGMQVALWVSATNRSALVAAFAHAWELLHPGPSQTGGGDAARDAAAFLSWLEKTDRDWMIALDDVQNPRDVTGLWPTGPAGRVLVTTRRRDAAMTGHGRGTVDVGVYGHTEAGEFLRQKLANSPVPDVLDQAEELAEDLGLLPLALSQAGATILDEAITCREYRALLADRTLTLDEVLASNSGDDYSRTVASTWTLAAQLADRLPPVGLAGRVLRVAAVLDPNGSPAVVFEAAIARALLAGDSQDVPPSSSVEGSVRRVRTALRNLHRLSLIAHDPTAAGAGVVRMHALAQRAALEALPYEAVRATVQVAADALLECWPGIDRGRELAAMFTVNAQALARRDEAALWSAGVHGILVQAGKTLGLMGQVTAARDHFTDLAETARSRLEVDHLDTLRLQYMRGKWQREAGDPAAAVVTLAEVLARQIRRLGADHPDTLTTRYYLARSRGSAGDPAGAVAALDDLLSDRIRVLGPDHADTLGTRLSLAYWQGEAGDHVGAVGAFSELIADYQRVLGPDHDGTLFSRHELAYWQGEAGDPDGAVAALQALLADRMGVLGPDHPETLATRQSLAYWRGAAGDPAAAVDGFADLLPDLFRLLGSEHPRTLDTRHQLACARGDAGDPAGAVHALEELLADQHQAIGPDHPNTLLTRQRLARWRAEAGDVETATAALETLLSDQLRVLGKDHPHTRSTIHRLTQLQNGGP